MIGYSLERASRMHLDQLRREAYVEAQIRRARGRAGSRIAAALRAFAARLESPERAVPGPWREDFHHGVVGRA